MNVQCTSTRKRCVWLKPASYFTIFGEEGAQMFKKSTVFILHFAPSLRITLSLQSAFYTQSAFYPWSAVCILHWPISDHCLPRYHTCQSASCRTLLRNSMRSNFRLPGRLEQVLINCSHGPTVIMQIVIQLCMHVFLKTLYKLHFLWAFCTTCITEINQGRFLNPFAPGILPKKTPFEANWMVFWSGHRLVIKGQTHPKYCSHMSSSLRPFSVPDAKHN